MSFIRATFNSLKALREAPLDVPHFNLKLTK